MLGQGYVADRTRRANQLSKLDLEADFLREFYCMVNDELLSPDAGQRFR